MPAPDEISLSTSTTSGQRRARKKSSSDELLLRKLSAPLLPPKPGGICGPTISVSSSTGSNGKIQSTPRTRRRGKSQSSSTSLSSDQVTNE